jgi:hypothetical protein
VHHHTRWEFFWVFFLFCSTGVWSQDLTLGRHSTTWATPPPPIMLLSFFNLETYTQIKWGFFQKVLWLFLFACLSTSWQNITPTWTGPRIPLCNPVLTWHFGCMVSDQPIANDSDPLDPRAPHNNQNLYSDFGWWNPEGRKGVTASKIELRGLFVALGRKKRGFRSSLTGSPVAEQARPGSQAWPWACLAGTGMRSSNEFLHLTPFW